MNSADAIWEELASQLTTMAADEVDPENRRLMLEIAVRYDALAERSREQATELMKHRD